MTSLKLIGAMVATLVALALPVVISLVGAGMVVLTVVVILYVVKVYRKMDDISSPVVEVHSN